MHSYSAAETARQFPNGPPSFHSLPPLLSTSELAGGSGMRHIYQYLLRNNAESCCRGVEHRVLSFPPPERQVNAVYLERLRSYEQSRSFEASFLGVPTVRKTKKAPRNARANTTHANRNETRNQNSAIRRESCCSPSYVRPPLR